MNDPDSKRRRLRRRLQLWDDPVTRDCCWCLEATMLEHGPFGQPLLRTAIMEHPQSLHHPDGRSDISQTRLSHLECNRTINRIEKRAKAGKPQSETDVLWLRWVTATHAESDVATELRLVIARLLALAESSEVEMRTR